MSDSVSQPANYSDLFNQIDNLNKSLDYKEIPLDVETKFSASITTAEAQPTTGASCPPSNKAASPSLLQKLSNLFSRSTPLSSGEQEIQKQLIKIYQQLNEAQARLLEIQKRTQPNKLEAESTLSNLRQENASLLAENANILKLENKLGELKTKLNKQYPKIKISKLNEAQNKLTKRISAVIETNTNATLKTRLDALKDIDKRLNELCKPPSAQKEWISEDDIKKEREELQNTFNILMKGFETNEIDAVQNDTSKLLEDLENLIGKDPFGKLNLKDKDIDSQLKYIEARLADYNKSKTIKYKDYRKTLKTLPGLGDGRQRVVFKNKKDLQQFQENLKEFEENPQTIKDELKKKEKDLLEKLSEIKKKLNNMPQDQKLAIEITTNLAKLKKRSSETTYRQQKVQLAIEKLSNCFHKDFRLSQNLRIALNYAELENIETLLSKYLDKKNAIPSLEDLSTLGEIASGRVLDPRLKNQISDEILKLKELFFKKQSSHSEFQLERQKTAKASKLMTELAKKKFSKIDNTLSQLQELMPSSHIFSKEAQSILRLGLENQKISERVELLLKGCFKNKQEKFTLEDMLLLNEIFNNCRVSLEAEVKHNFIKQLAIDLKQITTEEIYLGSLGDLNFDVETLTSDELNILTRGGSEKWSLDQVKQLKKAISPYVPGLKKFKEKIELEVAFLNHDFDIQKAQLFELELAKAPAAVKKQFFNLQELLGSHFSIPINYRIALLVAFQNAEFRKNFEEIINKAADTKIKQERAINNNTFIETKGELGPLIVDAALIFNSDSPTFQMLIQFIAMLEAKTGGTSNTQPMHDMLELGLQTPDELKEIQIITRTLGLIETSRKNAEEHSYLTKAEKDLMKEGFLFYDQYNVWVKNQWQSEDTDIGVKVHWVGNFATLTKENILQPIKKSVTIDLNVAGKDRKKQIAALAFAKTWSNAEKELHKSLKKAKNDLKLIDSKVRPILAEDTFWKKLDDTPDLVTDSERNEVANRYQQLMDTAQKFRVDLEIAHRSIYMELGA